MNPKEKIGKLDQKVTIESYTEAVGTDGYRTKSWSSFLSCWAERLPRERGWGQEKFEGEQLTAINKVFWRIRYKSGVTERMRVKDSGNLYYYVVAIHLEGRQRWILLETEKRD